MYIEIKCSTISVAAMTGAAIAIDDASAADTIRSVKQRVFAANRQLPVRRQRLVYRPGPRGMEALADDETLGGAGVARDGTAELDVLLEPLTEVEVAELGPQLLEAARNGSMVEMLDLLSEGVNIEFWEKRFYNEKKTVSTVSDHNFTAYTALIWAARNGHVDCVRALIDAGADKEAKENIVCDGGNVFISNSSVCGLCVCTCVFVFMSDY